MGARPRQGALLLEVLLALGLLVAGAISILSIVRTGAGGLTRVRELDHAANLARSAMAQIEAGLASPESLHGPIRDSESPDSPGEPVSGLEYAIDTQPSAFPGLTQITVRVVARGQVLGGDDQTRFELRQLVALQPRGVPRRRPRRRRIRSRSNGSDRRAFTLLEVLISLALLAMLIGTMMGFLWNLLEQRRVLGMRAQQDRQVAAAIDRLEADLLTVVASHSTHPSGFSGDQTSLRVLTRGVVLAGTQAEAEQWTSDLQWVSWRFDPASGSLVHGRSHEPGAASEASVRPMAEQLGRVELAFAHEGRWIDRFDAKQQGGLPRAVRVRIWTSRATAALESPELEADEASPASQPFPPDVDRIIAVPLLPGDLAPDAAHASAAAEQEP